MFANIILLLLCQTVLCEVEPSNVSASSWMRMKQLCNAIRTKEPGTENKPLTFTVLKKEYSPDGQFTASKMYQVRSSPKESSSLTTTFVEIKVDNENKEAQKDVSRLEEDHISSIGFRRWLRSIASKHDLKSAEEESPGSFLSNGNEEVQSLANSHEEEPKATENISYQDEAEENQEKEILLRYPKESYFIHKRIFLVPMNHVRNGLSQVQPREMKETPETRTSKQDFNNYSLDPSAMQFINMDSSDDESRKVHPYLIRIPVSSSENAVPVSWAKDLVQTQPPQEFISSHLTPSLANRYIEEIPINPPPKNEAPLTPQSKRESPVPESPALVDNVNHYLIKVPGSPSAWAGTPVPISGLVNIAQDIQPPQGTSPTVNSFIVRIPLSPSGEAPEGGHGDDSQLPAAAPLTTPEVETSAPRPTTPLPLTTPTPYIHPQSAHALAKTALPIAWPSVNILPHGLLSAIAKKYSEIFV